MSLVRSAAIVTGSDDLRKKRRVVQNLRIRFGSEQAQLLEKPILLTTF